MKKNVFYSVMAMFMMLFVASCSQDEIVSVNQPGDGVMRLSVKVPAATPNTRAVIPVEGYTMRCVMEILDAENNRLTISNADGEIGVQYSVNVEMSNGSANFEFVKPEGASKYLFWADYVGGKENISMYETNNGLQNITYARNKNSELFNNLAMDAFCANVTEENIANTVTLKRPLTRIAVRASDVAELGIEGLNLITPQMRSGQGFDVNTGAVSEAANLRTTETEGVLEAIPALTEGDFVFFCYVFPAIETETSASTIKFTSESDTEGHALQIPVAAMQTMNDNTSYNLINDEELGGGDEDPTTTTVKVEIDNGYADGTIPGTGNEPLPMEVGSYINAEGEVVADAADAVGIVFYLGAMGNDVPGNYPVSLGIPDEGATTRATGDIKGYAVALENVATSRQQLNAEAIPEGFTPTESTLTNGTQAMDAFNTNFAGSAFLTSYNNWVAANPVSGDKISEWYIPTLSQLQSFMGMLFTIGDTQATGSEEFRGMDEFALINGVMFDRDPIATVYYVSSSVNTSGNPSGIRINVTDGVINNASAAGLNVVESVQSALCRPMITIFE